MWFVNVSFSIVGYDATENYMLLRIHNWCMWVDYNAGKVANICKLFLHIPYQYKLKQTATPTMYWDLKFRNINMHVEEVS